MLLVIWKGNSSLLLPTLSLGGAVAGDVTKKKRRTAGVVMAATGRGSPIGGLQLSGMNYK
jgi:hypothetical protein